MIDWLMPQSNSCSKNVTLLLKLFLYHWLNEINESTNVKDVLLEKQKQKNTHNNKHTHARTHTAFNSSAGLHCTKMFFLCDTQLQ